MDKTAHSRRNEGIHRLWRERLEWLSRRDSPGPGMEGPHERSLIRRLTYLATLLGIIAALVGAGYLAAWLGGYMSQRGLSRITMKTNTALCLTLVGAALTLLVPTAVGQARRWVARVCAAFAFLVGLLTFTENLWGWDFGIDQVLAIEVPGAIAVVNPNRMGTPASASFTLIGLALLIFSRRDRRGTRVAQSLALAVCLIGLLSTIGFLYGAREFYGIARYTGIAWPTAVALLLLGIGLLCARPAEGLMAQVTANDPGGVNIRRLLPPFVLLPLLLGWLRLVGERAGIFDAPTGTGLMMLLFIIIFSTLAYHTSHRASRSANALCESEDRFRTMANAIPQLAWIARADGYTYWYNQRWYDYTGTTPAQMEGWGWQSVHDPQQLPGVLDRWKSSIATGEPFDMIFPLRGADGIFRPFLTRVMPLKDDQGRVQQWFGTNTDVSEQRKAQEERERLLHEVSVHAAQLQEANERLAAVNEELAASNEELKATTEELQSEIEDRKQAEEALRESEEHYRSLFGNMLNGFAFCRMLFVENRPVDFTYLEVNRAFEALTGLKNVVGKNVSEVIPGLRDTNPELFEIYGRVALTGRPEQLETYVAPLDMWFLISVYSPQREYFVAVFDVITERKQTEKALREWNATLESKIAQRTAELQHRAQQLQKLTLQLSQAEEQERRRLAVILHEDLQQQIAGAKFHLSLVRGRAREERQQTDIDAVDGMLKGAIEKSRTLSRDLSPAVLHMNDLAELLQWLANRLRAQQGLSINLDVSGDMMLHSEALATFLFRAAQEMLFNVVKHAYVREAALRVRRIRRYVCLSVSDQGRGFDPQELKETSGMGLFSIRERTELLGGHLKVKSAKGKGSKLSIVVPDGPPVTAPPPSRVDLPQPRAAGLPSGGAVRVLLVDDHDVVRAGLAALLRDTPGIALVGEAPDGREAINMAIDLEPDVVIMDVSMPLMSGDQATRQIKAHLPQTRVIALSMYDEAEKKERMFEAGAEGYILKTVSAEDLLTAIRGEEPDS